MDGRKDGHGSERPLYGGGLMSLESEVTMAEVQLQTNGLISSALVCGLFLSFQLQLSRWLLLFFVVVFFKASLTLFLIFWLFFSFCVSSGCLAKFGFHRFYARPLPFDHIS